MFGPISWFFRVSDGSKDHEHLSWPYLCLPLRLAAREHRWFVISGWSFFGRIISEVRSDNFATRLISTQSGRVFAHVDSGRLILALSPIRLLSQWHSLPHNDLTFPCYPFLGLCL